MPDSLSRTFARYVTALQYEELPAEAVDKIKASVLHALVVSIVGLTTTHGRAAVELVQEEETKPDGATILAAGGRATRCGAAFANSKLMHATNQSDSYRMLTHPGPCVIPSALATAELAGASGRQFLTALAAGYEVESRIAGDFIPTVQARGFRSSPLFGTLGAAVGSGKLLGLTEDQMVTALALASTFTAGTNEGPRSGGREMMFHEPQATRSGIMAALLARENVRGSETSLEGDAGFYNAFTGNNRGELSYVFQGPTQVSFDPVVAELGQRWELMHIVPKIYPTAGYNCPVIELMTDIRASHDVPIAEIDKITVDMNWLETTYPSPAFPNLTRTSPGVGSTHYFTAYTCVNGSYPPLRQRIEAGEASPGDESVVMDLLKRTEVLGHKDRPAFAPRITISLKDGTTYQGEYSGQELEWGLETESRRISAIFNDIDWPLVKFNSLVETVSRLDEEPDLSNLVSLCVPE